MNTPLRDRIAARRGEPVRPQPAIQPKPEPVRPPRWLERLAAKDTTGLVLS
jgi:hypothetical protein